MGVDGLRREMWFMKAQKASLSWVGSQFEANVTVDPYWGGGLMILYFPFRISLTTLATLAGESVQNPDRKWSSGEFGLRKSHVFKSIELLLDRHIQKLPMNGSTSLSYRTA